MLRTGYPDWSRSGGVEQLGFSALSVQEFGRETDSSTPLRYGRNDNSFAGRTNRQEAETECALGAWLLLGSDA